MVKESACECRRGQRCGIDPWAGKIPWRRAWQPTAVFLPGEFHGQRNLGGYSPWGCKELEMTESSGTDQGGRGQPGSRASTRTEPNLQVLSCLGCLHHRSRVFFFFFFSFSPVYFFDKDFWDAYYDFHSLTHIQT